MSFQTSPHTGRCSLFHVIFRLILHPCSFQYVIDVNIICAKLMEPLNARSTHPFSSWTITKWIILEQNVISYFTLSFIHVLFSLHICIYYTDWRVCIRLCAFVCAFERVSVRLCAFVRALERVYVRPYVRSCVLSCALLSALVRTLVCICTRSERAHVRRYVHSLCFLRCFWARLYARLCAFSFFKSGKEGS